MSKERIIGIDFGTSTTVIRVKNYDEYGQPVGGELHKDMISFDERPLVPSVICCFNDVYSFGYDAEYKSGKRNAKMFYNFKIQLQSDNPDEKEQAEQLIKKYFKYLYNNFEQHLNSGALGGDDTSVNKTIVSYPVKWDSEMSDFMIKTAKEANFENVTGMDEAEAAIRAVTVQCKSVIKKSGLLKDGQASNIMLIDMGAGTTDIVICKYTPGDDIKNEILTTWPQSGNILFGGQEMDEILKEYVISKFPKENQEEMRKAISIAKVKEWKENDISKAIASYEVVEDFAEADIIAYYRDIDFENIYLDRTEFEKLFHDYMSNFVKLISGAIEDSGISAEDIDLVVLTGGHSNWYFVKDLLLGKNEHFESLGLTKIIDNPNRILSVALPQETVALGLVYSKISGKIPKEEKDLDDPAAICNLAYRYYNGTGGMKRNLMKAIQLYKKAADMGNMKAVYNLGVCYYEKSDWKKAFLFFKKASTEGGMCEATFNMGVCFQNGEGISKNENVALELYKRAYEEGYSEAKKYYDMLFIKNSSKQQTVGTTQDGQTIWRCPICGYEYIGEELPNDFVCPICKHPSLEMENIMKILEYAMCLYDKTYPKKDYAYGKIYIGSHIPKDETEKFLLNFDLPFISDQKYICYSNMESVSNKTSNDKYNGFLITDTVLYRFERSQEINFYMLIQDIKEVVIDNNDSDFYRIFIIDNDENRHLFLEEIKIGELTADEEKNVKLIYVFLKNLIEFIKNGN